MASSADFNTLGANALAPNAIGGQKDYAFQILTNPGAVNATPQSLKLIVAGEGLTALQKRAFELNQGSELPTGELKRAYQEGLPSQMDQLTYEEPDQPSFITNAYDYGTLVFKQKTFDDPYTGRRYTTPELLIDAALFNARMSKNITKTMVQGRRGSVKEFNAEGDWFVTIKGVLVGKDLHSYPADKVNVLKRILQVPDSLRIEAKQLNQLGITDIVIEDIDLPQREGSMNYQLFTLDCVSDDPIELKVKGNQG